MVSAIHIIVLIFALFALSRAVLRWKERAISVFEFLFWTSVWTVLLILVLIPDVTTIVSRWWGIGRGIDSILYVSIIALFYLIFRLYVKQEAHQQAMTKLVRYYAIVNARKNGKLVERDVRSAVETQGK